MKRLAVAAIVLLVLMAGIALGEGSGLSIDAPRAEPMKAVSGGGLWV